MWLVTHECALRADRVHSTHVTELKISSFLQTKMQLNIVDTFRDGTVLITGGTGFLGKLLTEKLLNSCSVKNIAVLVRSKKGLTVSQRVADLYKQTVSIFFNFFF